MGENATHFSNQSLDTASLDGVVSKKADAVYAVGEDAIIVLPEDRVGRREDNPLQGVKESTDQGSIVSRTQCSDPVGVSGVCDKSTMTGPQRSTGPDSRGWVWTPQPAEADVVGTEPSVKIEAVGFRTRLTQGNH